MKEDVDMIGKSIEERRDEIIQLASKLIHLDTQNPPGYTDEIVNFIEDKLNGLDKISIERFEKVDRKPGLIVSLNCGDAPVVSLVGHLDVVPANPEKWSFTPLSGKIEEGYLYGRGASDMKGGVASMMIAFEELAKHSGGLSGTIKLILVPDEETSGEAGIDFLDERSDDPLNCDACIIGEPSLIHHPTIGQKGSFWFELKANGESEHGSLQPWAGKNAIRELISAIDELSTVSNIENDPDEVIEDLIQNTIRFKTIEGLEEDQSLPLRRVSFNPGLIEGGSKINVVPDEARAEIDMRIPIGLKNTMIEKLVRNIIDKYSIGLKILQNTEPNFTSPEDTMILKLVEQIEKTLNDDKQVVPVLQYASSDARIFRKRDIPTVQYGPCEMKGIHGVDEKVKTEDIVKCAVVYGRTIMDLLSENQ